MLMELTNRARMLLDALKQAGGAALTRAELADATGKRALSPHDRYLLEGMARDGLIDISTEPASVPRGVIYKYRFVKDIE